MKESFDIINKNSKTESKYFYASRRASIVPSFSQCEDVNEIFTLMTLPDTILLKTFIKRVGLEDVNLEVILKKYNLQLEEKYTIAFMKENENFQSFMKEIFHLIVNNAIIERKNIEKYAKKNQFYGKVAIVDIGWNGTMQKSLMTIFNNEIYGFYMGLIPDKKAIKNEFFKGFIFDCMHDEEMYCKFHNFIDIFEFLFLAQHGSVKRFNDNSVEFYAYEYENYVEKKYVCKIQKGALDFIKKENVKKEKMEVINDLLSVFLNPTLEDAILWGNLLFMNNDINYIGKPKSIFYYIFHIRMLKQDFINSGWRIGFLKRLLKIKLPYFKINEILRKIFIKKGD